MNIGIAGLGLIGASLAKAVTDHTEHRAFGWNRSEDTLKKALHDGIITGILDEKTIPACDVIFVALYHGAAIEYIKKNAELFNKRGLVIDCCGVKKAICDEIFSIAENFGFTFVGGHPMAGLAHSGYDYSTGELFRGASMILTPREGDRRKIAWIDQILRGLGFGDIVYTTPERHDREIAYTSQLAHIISSAYVMSDASLAHRGFSAGSFRDLTRVAWLNEDMWTELFLDNRAALSGELDDMITRLTAFRDAISGGDEQKLRALLKAGRERKERVEKL